MWCKNDFYACLLLSSHPAVETEDGQSPEKGLNKLLDDTEHRESLTAGAGMADGDKARLGTVPPRAWFQRWSGFFWACLMIP